MKYFTDEFWSKINSKSAIERDLAHIVWEQNLEAYSRVFENYQI